MLIVGQDPFGDLQSVHGVGFRGVHGIVIDNGRSFGGKDPKKDEM